MATQFTTVDEYVATLSDDVRSIVEEVRRRIRKVVPSSEETISYGMPTVKLDDRYLVYFAGWKNHLAIYPIPAGDEAFERDLAPYRAVKGTARFPYDQAIPYDL